MAWILTTVVAAAWSGDFDAESSNALTMPDRLGNVVSVSNRFDGTNYYIQISYISPNRGVIWDRYHNDGYQERANAMMLDGGGQVYVVGTRIYQGHKYLWLMKLASTGNLLWEKADVEYDCSGLGIFPNDSGDVWVAGSCSSGRSFPARILRYNTWGAQLWSQNFDEGGRNYVRGVNLDFGDRLAVTLEVLAGSYRGKVRTVVYDRNGWRLAIY